MQQDASTLLRSSRRASYGAAAQTGRRASAGSPSTASISASGPGSATTTTPTASTVAVGPRNESSYGVDTWSAYLWQQWCVQKALAACPADDTAARAAAVRKAADVARACGAPPVGTLRRVDMLATLQTLIAQQNNELVTMRQETLSRRRQESAQHTPSPVHSPPRADGGPSEAKPAPAPAVEDAGLENTLTVSVLARLLEPCREKWQALLSARFTSTPAPASEGAAAQVAALPTSQELLQCLVDGLQTDTARRYIAVDLLHVELADLTVGIDPQGLLTNFEAPVQVLTSLYPNIVPTLAQLRDVYFADLDPAKGIASFTDSFLDSTLEVMEDQLDTVLRHGSTVEALADILREGVHPSLRRLVYARALQLALTATDGQPLFAGNGSDLFVNGTSPSLPSYLSCGTKYARDKVRRRYHHYYSSPAQAALVARLQAAMRADNAATTSNDERYFVYEEETATLGAALVADKSLPDAKLKTALRQLGHDEDTFEAYITFLAQKDGDWIVPKAPPCGFVPLAGTSRLLAPLGYVTGDTTEQYELASALFAQLWCRLHGPTPELAQCCWLFERLVATLAPQAVLHATRALGCPPLPLAVEWMTTGFVDVLEPSELLLLWDLVLAYHTRELVTRSPLASLVGLADVEALEPDPSQEAKAGPTASSEVGKGAAENQATSPSPTSPAACALWVLPLFAAALFVWRAPLIEACQTPEQFHALFAAGHNIRARAVLQQLLFLMNT